jgi:hypothetical protein
MGVHVCKTLPALVRAFEVGMNERVSVVVEELIEGKDTSISVLRDFRGQGIYPFLCIGRFSEGEKREVERIATQIHQSLNLGHFSQSHFIVTPRKGIYVTDVKILPELHSESVLHSHLESVGVRAHEFIDHIIKHALDDK